MSDVKSLFRKKTKQAVKAKAEPVKLTVEEEEDDEWGVTSKPTEQLYMGDRKAAELIVGAYSDVNLATKIAHDDTKALLHEARKKAVSAVTTPQHEAPVEAPKPVPAPAEQTGGRWRSRRVMVEQGLAPPLPGGSGSSSNGGKIEEFPALGGFPSLGGTAGTAAAGTVPTKAVAATGTWGRVGGEEEAAHVTVVSDVVETQEKKEPTPTAAATPPATEKEDKCAPPAAPVVREAEAVAPAGPLATAKATTKGDADVEALAEGVAVVDLKGKFGTKKKKKKAIDMDA